jgi:hypothetical protein
MIESKGIHIQTERIPVFNLDKRVAENTKLRIADILVDCIFLDYATPQEIQDR